MRTLLRLRYTLGCVAALLFLAAPLQAQLIQAPWTGAVSPLWGDAGNWAGGVVPNDFGSTTYAVRIDDDPLVDSRVILDVGATVTGVRIDAGDVLEIPSFVSAVPYRQINTLVNAGQFLVSRDVTLVSGERNPISNSGLIRLSSPETGAVTLNLRFDATLSGGGELLMESSQGGLARLVPGTCSAID